MSIESTPNADAAPTDSPAGEGPLAGVLVLDLTRALAGVSWASALVMPRSRVDALLHDPATLVRVLTEADAAINCTGEGSAQRRPIGIA